MRALLCGPYYVGPNMRALLCGPYYVSPIMWALLCGPYYAVSIPLCVFGFFPCSFFDQKYEIEFYNINMEGKLMAK